MLDEINDKRLIKNFLEEDTQAIATIEDWVVLVAHHMIRLGILNEQEREDLVQEALKEVWRNLRHGKFQYRSSLKTYVWRTAQILCLKQSRKRAKGWECLHDNEEYDIAAPAPDPSQVMEQSEQKRIFEQAKAQAPERCRQLWQMLFEKGMNYQEIAQVMGMSYENVRVTYTRCKERLMEITRKLTSAKSGGAG